MIVRRAAFGLSAVLALVAGLVAGAGCSAGVGNSCAGPPTEVEAGSYEIDRPQLLGLVAGSTIEVETPDDLVLIRYQEAGSMEFFDVTYEVTAVYQ